ncbi:MAG: hypothetical protein AAF433_08920 [Bacteroidota bacterium]
MPMIYANHGPQIGVILLHPESHARLLQSGDVDDLVYLADAVDGVLYVAFLVYEDYLADLDQEALKSFFNTYADDKLEAICNH